MALVFGLSRIPLLCGVSRRFNMKSVGHRSVSHTTTPPVLQRIVNMVRNDPFVKVSLSLCVIVGGGTLVMELYKKWKKNAPPKVLLFPSGFAHYSVSRQSMVSHIQKELQQLRSKCNLFSPLLYVTGPPGCGKTEVVRQFCNNATVAKKWFGLKSVTPIVLCLDAGSPTLLQASLAEAASGLGIQPASNLENLFSMVLTGLSSKQSPWFLIVDNLTKDSSSLFESLVNKLTKMDGNNQGAILITSRLPPQGLVHSVCEVSRLNVKQSVDLLEGISGFQCIPPLLQLLEVLQYNPMAVALAASTIKMYHSSQPDTELPTIIKSYQQQLTGVADIQQATVNLYCEAAISDSRIRHTFDFLGLCDLDYPVLLSALPIHLSADFHGLSEEALALPPLDPILAKLKPTGHDSYWSRFKSVVPFLSASVPSDDDIAKALKESQDEVAFIRQSPLLSFKRSWCSGGFEFVTVHSVAHRRISELFIDTAAKLDRDFVSREFLDFQRKTWFKHYRTFDSKKALRKFHRSLPGLSSSGVFTELQFHDIKSVGSEGSVDATISKMSYSQYVHTVSHYHRVLMSLTATLRSIKGEIRDVLMEKYLLPHFKAIKDFSYTSESDKLTAEISMLSIDAGSSSGDHTTRCITRYEQLIAKQKALLGTKSIQVASSLVDLADLQLSSSDASAAKDLLQLALSIYNQVPAHLQHGAFALDEAHAFSSLGLACGELGEKEKSKDFYEQALATSQSVPSNGTVGVRQRKVVASLLVNVTHAYLCLGDLPVAKKYCELAAMMLQSVYPQGHAEIIRLFNIRSIVSALMGDKEESSKYRAEASKLKAKLDTL